MNSKRYRNRLKREEIMSSDQQQQAAANSNGNQQKGKGGGLKQKKKPPKPFDFSKYPQRHIILKLAYHGQTHDGLAKQDHTKNTIEQYVVDALKFVRLIPETGPEKFSRCARTDKGVSALGNSFSLMVRASTDDSKPLDYCHMINSRLPDTIRIIGWCFIPDDFDARFSCKNRTYRYFFSAGGLDVEAMRTAGQYLVGEHDFRNFCKMDVVNVSNFVREIMHLKIKPVFAAGNNATASTDVSSAAALHYVEIKATAFLYHQIRCIMTILFLVGQKLETPEVVKQMLDVEKIDAKPCYPLAPDAPLVLWDCYHDDDVVKWNIAVDPFHQIVNELKHVMDVHAIRAAIAAEMNTQLHEWYPEEAGSKPTDRSRPHEPLLTRPREHTFDMRVESLSANKKKRRDINIAKGKPKEGEEEAAPAE